LIESVKGRVFLHTTIFDFLVGGDHNNLQRLIDAGLVSVVLALLSQCEDEEFCDIVEADATAGFEVVKGQLISRNEDEQEGRVSEPKVWMRLLLNAVGNEPRLDVKQNLSAVCRLFRELLLW